MQLTAHIDRADEAGKKIYLDMFVDIPSHTMANSFTFSKFFFWSRRARCSKVHELVCLLTCTLDWLSFFLLDVNICTLCGVERDLYWLSAEIILHRPCKWLSVNIPILSPLSLSCVCTWRVSFVIRFRHFFRSCLIESLSIIPWWWGEKGLKLSWNRFHSARQSGRYWSKVFKRHRIDLF